MGMSLLPLNSHTKPPFSTTSYADTTNPLGPPPCSRSADSVSTPAGDRLCETGLSKTDSGVCPYAQTVLNAGVAIT